MSVNLDIVNNFTVTVRGVTFTGRQGTDSNATDIDPFTISVTGDIHSNPFTLATATALTIWNDADDTPLDFNYLFFIADQNMFIQIICTVTSFIIPVLAGVPFVLAPKTDTLTAKALGANTTTPMSGAAPAVTEIHSIVVQNNSGNTAHGMFCAVN